MASPTSIPLVSFPQGAKSAIRVSLDGLDGRTFVNARFWYENRSGEWRPTTRGVTFEADELERLAKAIATAIDLARAT